MNPPPFPANALWLNTDRPFRWDDLKGHVVILDFWTYCCINCIHVLEDLKWLEEKYAGEPVVVIGVHSPKFDNERDPTNVESAIARYNIEHPVLVDSDHEFWDAFSIQAWPSFIVVGPDGKVREELRGEGVRAPLDERIARLLEEGRAAGALAQKKIGWKRPERPDSALSFPGKLAVDPAGKRLFVSDSNHGRILEIALDSPDSGKIKRAFGDPSQFLNPQGLHFDSENNCLYVCDTGNHALKAVDLQSGGITLLADGLNSPWDVTEVGGYLFVAMAGAHQIWGMDLATGDAGPFAGSGIENLSDGAADAAQLAQPSGIATDGQNLYFADSEVSAIRQASLEGGTVETLIGRGLFEFGHVDGPADEALLQHCLGVCHWKGLLFVADTYNHAVRMIDIQSRQIVSIIYRDENEGVCRVGDEACEILPLFEPNDVKVFDEGLPDSVPLLYIADTNNHLIRVFDLREKTLSDLAFY